MVDFDKILFFLALEIFSLTIRSQTIDPPYEVATWKGSCDAAVTYTFDDGCSNQFSKAIPLFNEFGYHGTFFTVTNWSPNWTALQNAASQGHEVASHTVSHPDLSTLDATEQNTELENSADIINDHIEGLNGMTLAYPYCIPGIDSITVLYYFAARGCQGFVEPSTPGDFLNISSIICGELGDVNSTEAFQQRVDAAASSNGWCVYLIHGIDNDGGYSPLASSKLRASLEYLDANRDKFWVATFGNVARYIRERNCLTVNALEETDDTIKLELGDTLDNEIYDQPVTLRRPLPEGWKFARGLLLKLIRKNTYFLMPFRIKEKLYCMPVRFP
jgi:peptidoglycan/xylan/chitin deacetylase (PgdA/CDA1 family)